MSQGRFARSGWGKLAALALAAAAAGCASDEELPDCENCEFWDQVTPGLARFPEPHPTSPAWILFSTVEKTPGAPDSDRDTDEDIWLLERGADLASTTKWQLTDDALGTGDNFAATWSPSGTQIGFVHTTAGGAYEVWRMPVMLPAASGSPPVLGTPERMTVDARDVTWATETSLIFSRNDKLWSLSIPASPGPPTASPMQLTFDPPSFSSTETYVDRHPSFAADGGAVFSTIGRQNVADVMVRAFEVDDAVFPPDTTSTAAWLSYQSPAADDPTYPVFIGIDTLRTPRLLRSIPVFAGGTFQIGVRLDSSLLPGGAASYCDTTLVIPADLQPGDADTLAFYFHVVRGALLIESEVSQTDVFWTRKDVRETISDFTSDTRLDNLGEQMLFECLMPYSVNPDESIAVGVQETLIVSGARGTLTDTARVVIDPGRTTEVTLFPAGTVSGTVSYSDNPPTVPPALVEVFLAGTADLISSSISDGVGNFIVNNVPAGTFDVTLSATGYTDVTLTGVVVSASVDNPLGTITMNPGPAPARGRTVAAAPDPRRAFIAPAARVSRNAAARAARPGGLGPPFRAEGDLTTIWRLDFDPASLQRPPITELVGSETLLQNPVVTSEFAGGVRYLAYVGNESGPWKVYVQRLVNWQRDGAPLEVVTPGTTVNLDCDRNVFHPRWTPDSTPGSLRLLVTMTDCPANGFEEVGFDDDPWAVGEIRVWEVALPAGL
jgi:hypothetical protein